MCQDNRPEIDQTLAALERGDDATALAAYLEITSMPVPAHELDDILSIGFRLGVLE